MKINHILDVWIICKYFRGAPLIHSQFSQQVLTIYIYSRTMKRIEYFGIIIKKSTLSNSLKCRYFLCHYIHDPFFKNLFWNLKNFENHVKTRNFFSEKTKFWLFIPRNGFHTFSRHSSDYLQHSVLSPKRFRLLEMKLEQKVQTLPKIAVFG